MQVNRSEVSKPPPHTHTPPILIYGSAEVLTGGFHSSVSQVCSVVPEYCLFLANKMNLFYVCRSSEAG